MNHLPQNGDSISKTRRSMTMMQQIGRKLRQQIHYFSGDLCKGFGKVSSRFVEQVIFGISASGSVHLTEIGRALEEKISIHATHKRLSRNLADENLDSAVENRLLQLAAKRVKKDTLLVVDPSDLRKRYAEKMEYLADIRDGSDGSIGRGYWLCDVIACETGSNEITPLTQELWSQNAPDFKSENDQILSIVRRVREATEGRGIIVFDRGSDRRELLVPWTRDSSCRYMVRQRGDRHLLYKRSAKSGQELAELCKTPYSTKILREDDGKEKAYFIHYGFVPVRLPECPERLLWMVVVKGLGQQPLMILTTEQMRRNRKVLWWVVDAYLSRWRIEETIRFVKQSYDFEDIRVLTYQRLRNMAVLVLAASYFAAVWLGTRAKLSILALHAMDAAKRLFGIPDFRYYAIADGMQVILKRVGKGPIDTKPVTARSSPQMSLWTF
jgi:hypothetical protein